MTVKELDVRINIKESDMEKLLDNLAWAKLAAQLLRDMATAKDTQTRFDERLKAIEKIYETVDYEAVYYEAPVLD